MFSYFGPATKSDAREAARYWAAVKRHGVYLAGILGGLTGAGIIVAPIPAAASLATAWFADAQEAACKHLAEDPARPDFDAVTRPRPRPFFDEAFGSTRIERTTVSFGRRALSAAASVEATVRATEKAMGARRVQSHYETTQ